MTSKAIFNKDRTKRFCLYRKWDYKPNVTWIMLNPSVADENTNDKTVTRCINYSKKFGYGGLNIINLCSDIDTNPKKAIKKIKSGHIPDIEEMKYIIKCISNCETIYFAWGFNIKTPVWLKTLIRNKEVKALKTSKLGNPMHPLYLPNDIQPIVIHQ